MNLVDQPAHNREMAAHDAVKRVPEIARNHCPASAKYACTRLCDAHAAATGPLFHQQGKDPETRSAQAGGAS